MPSSALPKSGSIREPDAAAEYFEENELLTPEQLESRVFGTVYGRVLRGKKIRPLSTA